MRTPLKAAAVIIGAVILSTLAINASDSVRGISSSLVGLVIEESQTGGCPQGMIETSVRGAGLCVDVFEASPAEDCEFTDPKNANESGRNIALQSCIPESRENAVPWRFVSFSQAQEACAKAGKRLPTNEEWYRISLGVGDLSSCNTDARGATTPQKSEANLCRSASGVYNAIGNVWEWVDESVDDGVYAGRELPQTGYVTSVDTDGVALSTRENEPDQLFGDDYFWEDNEGVRGMIRGGFYGSGDDAGLYSVNASVELSFVSTGIGFRCVKDI